MTAVTVPQTLGDATGLELAELIRRRVVSSEEVTRFFLDRIATRDDSLASFVQVLGPEALRTARQKDKSGPADLAREPFHGVPLGIKDLNFVRGAFTRMGSRAFRPSTIARWSVCAAPASCSWARPRPPKSARCP